MKNKEEFCPNCPNHCSKNNLRCDRGRAYFNLSFDKDKREHQEGDGVFRLLKQCGHTLHHNPEINNEKLCECLSDSEQKILEDLLNKILNNLK